MLEFTPAESDDEPQDQSTRVRHGKHFDAKLERAARALGVSKSQFIRSAVDREASAVLRAQSLHVLTEDDVAAVNAALDMPPARTMRSERAARAYSRRVVHAD